jgi:uncharacterized protein DUF732
MNKSVAVLAAGLMALTASTSGGTAHADPNTDCLTGHNCVVPPEGGQGEAAHQARESDRAQEQSYLSWLRNQGHIPSGYSDADAVSRGRESCSTLESRSMGQAELTNELVAGGRLNGAAAADIVRAARTYFCPGA